MRRGLAAPGESLCERKRDRLRQSKMKPGDSCALLCGPSHGGAAHHGTAHRQGLKGSPTLPISQGVPSPGEAQ